MGGNGHILQLVTGQLKYNPRLGTDFLQMVKGGNTDISHHQDVHPCGFQDMIHQGRYRTFALGPGDSDNPVPKQAEKHLGLRENLTTKLFRRLLQHNAGTFENYVVVAQHPLIIRSKKPFSHPFFKRDFPLVRHIQTGAGAKLLQHLPGGTALPAKAQNQNPFSPNPGVQSLNHRFSLLIRCRTSSSSSFGSRLSSS